MQKGLTVLFLALFAASCPAQEALPSWNSTTQQAWWTKNPTQDTWPQALTDLRTQLEVMYKQNGTSAFSNPDFQGWLEHAEWIGMGLDCPDVLADPDSLKAFIALGKDEAVSHLFVEKFDIHDIEKPALKNILHLAQANADDLHEYAALGVAYSLVFDQHFPGYWPHSQVKKEAVPFGDLDIATRFAFYVQSDRDKKLDTDLTQLTFEDLKFLVDSEVKLSELAYAQKSRISYSHFADAFFAINYDMSRVQSGSMAFVWSFPTYHLADIEKNGGICVDQAYYASMLGKGRGIPTLYFHGQGTDGGHAWFGYMASSGKWELDCGRYESQNYPKGYALDPQTWQVIDDTVLTNFFKNGEKDPNYQPAQNALAWAKLHTKDPEATRKILDDARSIMPELAEAWQMEGAYLEHTNASDDDKKTFYESWIKQFSTYAGMKIEGQRFLLKVLKKSGDPAADDLQRDIVLQNRNSGFDEGISSAYTAISDKMDAGDWDGARLEYEKTIRDFGEQGGGTLYYGVIEPYIQHCLKTDHAAQAMNGIKFAEDRMTISSDSIIGQAFAELKGTVIDKQHAAASGP